MKEHVRCHHLWCVSLVVGITLSVCTDENSFFTAVSEADAAESEQAQQEFPVAEDPRPLTSGMEKELRGCFDFFWNEWVRDESLPTYGLNAGDYVGLRRHVPLAIESQGFYFPVIILGIERGWIQHEAGRQRVLAALDSLLQLRHFHGQLKMAPTPEYHTNILIFTMTSHSSIDLLIQHSQMIHYKRLKLI